MKSPERERKRRRRRRHGNNASLGLMLSNNYDRSSSSVFLRVAFHVLLLSSFTPAIEGLNTIDYNNEKVIGNSGSDINVEERLGVYRSKSDSTMGMEMSPNDDTRVGSDEENSGAGDDMVADINMPAALNNVKDNIKGIYDYGYGEYQLHEIEDKLDVDLEKLESVLLLNGHSETNLSDENRRHEDIVNHVVCLGARAHML